jgi:hypothetical protein
MMTQTFSEVLADYLEERDRQNSDYYDSRWLGARNQGQEYMQKLAAELDEMIKGIKND